MMIPTSKKAQISGLTTGLIFGIATLILGIIIAFVVVSTINDADLLTANEVTTTVTNETGIILNTTVGDTLAGAGERNYKFAITAIWANETGLYDVSIPTANATVGADGVIYASSTGAICPNETSVSYTYNTYTNEDFTSIKMITNLSEGVNNVSSKIPTVLLVAAIVLVLGILALLVATWQRMGVGSNI